MDGLLYVIRYRKMHTMHVRCALNQSTWTVSCCHFASAYSHTVHLVAMHVKCQDTVLGEMNIWIVYVINYDLHHHHVQEGLGLIPVPCILKMKLVPPSLPQSSYVSSSFGLNCSACLGILFVSILCMCCSHFSWYCFISFTIFSAPVFFLIHWFFSLSSVVIPRRCLKNFICAAAKWRFSSLAILFLDP